MASIGLNAQKASLTSSSQNPHQHFWAYGYTIPSTGKPLPCWKYFNPRGYSDYCLPRFLKIIGISYDNTAIADISSGAEVNNIRKPDGEIDIYDVVFIAGRYGLTQWDEMFDYQADTNGDGIIDLMDLVTVCAKFGEKCSWIPFSAATKIACVFEYVTKDFTHIEVREADSNGVVEVPYDVPYPYTVYVFPVGEENYVNAFVLLDFGEVYPKWADPYFEYGLDTERPEGVWHPMWEGSNIIDSIVLWNPGQFRLAMAALGSGKYGDMSAVSIVNGKAYAGKVTSLKYPYSFYGQFGNKINPGEAIIRYDAIPPLYINVDATLVHKEPIDPYKAELLQPRRINSGLVLWGWIDGFNDYQADVPHYQDQYITIEPTWLNQIWDEWSVPGHGFWKDDTWPPFFCSCYGDSSYHYLEHFKPKLNWSDGENLKFSLDLSNFIKREFEYYWNYNWWEKNAPLNLCGPLIYNLPEPQVLKNKRIIDVTDHIHIYGLHVYVECYWSILVMDFHEVSITNKPKYTVVETKM